MQNNQFKLFFSSIQSLKDFASYYQYYVVWLQKEFLLTNYLNKLT